MPVVNFPEFEQYKAHGYKGTFVGGCVERGEGSSFRRKAHAHCYPKYPHFGWICVRSPKRLYNKQGGASHLMWHEMAHIMTQDGHGRKFYIWLRDHDIIRKDEERTSQWAYLCRHYKDPVAAYNRIKGRKTGRCDMAVVAEKNTMEKADLIKMQAVINDPEAKHMGSAKAGGQWFKNYKTRALYRVDKITKDSNEYSLMETREAKVQAKKEDVINPAMGITSPSRKEMMEEARMRKIKYFRILSKSELMQVLSKETTQQKLVEIQQEAIRRWKGDKALKT